MIVAFWPHTRDPKIASFRLRCHRIVQGIIERGISCSLYELGFTPPRVLVLSKRYDQETIEHAVSLRNKFGTKLILDLCDNHFYSNSGNIAAIKRADALRYAIRSVDAIIASTDDLAKVVTQEADQSLDVHVIGDAVELPFEPEANQRFVHLFPEVKLALLKYQLEKNKISTGSRLVWFGNHGVGYADGGMNDLLRVKDVIEGLSQSANVSLTVISNSQRKFRKLISDWSIPTFYLPWNHWNFSRALALHDISVIPIGMNPFTSCKTNNRLVTSLVHGLAVVADSIPSYCEFAGSVQLNNWESGLEKYVKNPELRTKDIKTGLDIVQTNWSYEVIIDRWIQVIMNLDEC